MLVEKDGMEWADEEDGIDGQAMGMVHAWTGLDVLVRTCSAFKAVLAFKGIGCLFLHGDGNFGDREHVGAGGADCGKGQVSCGVAPETNGVICLWMGLGIQRSIVSVCGVTTWSDSVRTES